MFYLYAAQNRNKIITVMRDTAADCRDKVEPDWQQWLKDPNARIKQYENGEISVEELDAYLKQESLLDFFKINKSEHSYTLKSSGSKITFTGTDDESRAIGKTQHVLWVNEPYLFSEEVFKQLSQRTSSKNIGIENISVAGLSADKATIQTSFSEPVFATIQYGTSIDNLNKSLTSLVNKKNHEFELTNLTPNTGDFFYDAIQGKGIMKLYKAELS